MCLIKWDVADLLGWNKVVAFKWSELPQIFVCSGVVSVLLWRSPIYSTIGIDRCLLKRDGMQHPMCYLISACSDVSEPASKCQHVLVAPQNALLNISAPRTAAAGCLLPPSPPPPGPAASQALLWVLSSKKTNTPFAMLECCWLLHPEREPSHFNVHLYLQLIRWSKVFIWSRFGGAFQLFFPQLKTWPSLIRVLAQARVKFMFEFWHLGQNSEIWVTFSPKRLAVNHTLLHVW